VAIQPGLFDSITEAYREGYSNWSPHLNSNQVAYPADTSGCLA